MRFRKKPVEVEAIQITSTVRNGWRADWPDWAKEAWQKREGEPGSIYVLRSSEWGLGIATLEGHMEARVKDWIIQGVHGELYPCKPDIFAKTYEPVVDGSGLPVGCESESPWLRNWTLDLQGDGRWVAENKPGGIAFPADSLSATLEKVREEIERHDINPVATDDVLTCLKQACLLTEQGGNGAV